MSGHDETDPAAWQAAFIERFKRQERARGRLRESRLGHGELETAHRREWEASAPGLLGTLLLREVAAYLEFYVIARGTT